MSLRMFPVHLLLLCVSLIGCTNTELGIRQSSSPRNLWSMELPEFSWSNSPRQSISQLETLVRMRARDSSICFVWPSEIDEWMWKPQRTDVANVVSLLYRAATGAGIEVVLLGNSAIFTPSPDEVYTPLTVFITVIEKDTDALLEGVRFSADVLFPLQACRLEKGRYAVTIYAGASGFTRGFFIDQDACHGS